MRTILMVISLLYVGLLCSATYQEQFYKAYVSEEFELIEKLIGSMEAIENPSLEQRYELITCYYGYIPYCIYQNRKKRAELYCDRAEELCLELEDQKYRVAEVLAYRSVFYGYLTTCIPIKTAILGPKSLMILDKGYKLEPHNPFILMQKATVVLYMPKAFGGSWIKSIPLFAEAEKQFGSHPKYSKKDWLYLCCLAYYGNAYKQGANWQKALSLYNMALEIEPGFKLVKGKFMKELDQKRNSK